MHQAQLESALFRGSWESGAFCYKVVHAPDTNCRSWAVENAPMNRHHRRANAKLPQTSPDPDGTEFLQLGLTHHRAGHLAEAEACYRRVLATQPDHAEALHLLGLTAHQAGRHGSAAELIRQAIRQNGGNASYFSDLGAALKQQGHLDEAVAALGQAIRIKPDLAQAHCNLGAALRDQGKLEEAVAACRQAIHLRPEHAEAHSNLGVLLFDQGKLDEAVAAFRQAVRIEPDSVQSHINLGHALRSQGKLDEAVAAYRQAIRIRPDYAEAHSNLGALLNEQGKLDEAVAACRQAIRIRPDYAEAHSNLGIALFAQGKLDEAAAAHRQAIRIRPNHADAHANLGRVLHDQNMTDEAVAAFRHAILLEPNFAEAHNNLGLALRALGRLTEGRPALEEAVRLAPRNARFRRNLGEIARFVAGDPRLAAMEQMSQDGASLSDGERIELHFALGKAYEDLGRHAEAFRQWLDGNTLKRRQISYDETATLAAMDRIRTVFTSELFHRRQNVGQPSSIPVFIVGMMRSGTTLVEQILASHPQIFGGGEMKHFAAALKGIRATFGGSTIFPEPVPGMTDADFRDLGTRYLAEIERLAPAAARITDKLPGNFVFAGLIHMALPNARIIHTIRDPVDTCLSCFSKLFTAEQNHTYDLGELGRYYRHYKALMAHWHGALPAGRILDVRYEDVVADLEGQARRIVAYCGLEWDPLCLDFHQTDRPVRTASATQVRQPIYNSSIGRWRAHEPSLGPLLAELGTIGEPNLR
jgi:tetratricopeptide (TPR) repeat protein